MFYWEQRWVASRPHDWVGPTRRRKEKAGPLHALRVGSRYVGPLDRPDEGPGCATAGGRGSRGVQEGRRPRVLEVLLSGRYGREMEVAGSPKQSEIAAEQSAWTEEARY